MLFFLFCFEKSQLKEILEKLKEVFVKTFYEKHHTERMSWSWILPLPVETQRNKRVKCGIYMNLYI